MSIYERAWGEGCALASAREKIGNAIGSVPRPVPAGSRIKRFCSVRFGSAGSVRFLGFLPANEIK